MRTLTATALGLVLLFVAIWVWSRKGRSGGGAGGKTTFWMAVVVWLMLFAGLMFAPGGRFLIDEGVGLIERHAGPVLARFLGTSVAVVMFIIAVITALELANVLFSKGKGGGKKGGIRAFHPILALFAGAFFLAAGGWFASLVLTLTGLTGLA